MRRALPLLLLALTACAPRPTPLGPPVVAAPTLPGPAVTAPWTYGLTITGPDGAAWLDGTVDVPPDKAIEVSVRTPHCGTKGETPAIGLKLIPQTLPVFHLWLAVGDAQGNCAVVDQVMELAPGQVATLALPVSMGVHAQIRRPGDYGGRRQPPPVIRPVTPATELGRAALSAP